MDHSPGFLKVVNEARPRIQEIDVNEARAKLQSNSKAVLIDIREDNEWNNGHVADAIHLGRGILERDLEKTVPDHEAELILYCGGGYRSILSADSAQKMGYRNVYSLKGGYKALAASGWPMQ